MWEDFYFAGIMGLGWDELGDLNTYASKDEMAQKLRDIHGGDSSYKNSAHAVWQFVHDIKPGDVIFAKRGRNEILGRGVKEHPELNANASQIPWQLDDDFGDMLPVMQTDIMLTKGEKTLIIDAKYYAHTTQRQYDKNTLHSGNLYQIFTYVKNKEAELSEQPHKVSGMLLYARTNEEIYPEKEYKMSGNQIGVRTLNLDGDFDILKSQLDEIAEKFFGLEE